MSEFWKTAISQVKPNEILVRGYPIEQLTKECSFGDIVFLLLTGELPRRKQGRLIEAMLVASCEHSLLAPSVDAVRFVASSGVPLQTAVSAGVSAIGDTHGGAIEPCAKILQHAVENDLDATQVVAAIRSKKKRLPGYGHPIHTHDPRTKVLLALADELNLSGPHTGLARQIEAVTEAQIGKHLTMNVDGAIAALLCDLGIDPALGKAIFIIGRAPGFCAHAFEQAKNERPFKAPCFEEITYTGPKKRNVGDRNK